MTNYVHIHDNSQIAVYRGIFERGKSDHFFVAKQQATSLSIKYLIFCFMPIQLCRLMVTIVMFKR